MSRAELVSAFASFPDRLGDAARAAAAQPVMPGEWGLAEIVRHLIAVESEVHERRLAQVAAEDNPQWSWTEPGPAPGFDAASIDAILAAFAAARAASVATVRALDDDGWTRHGTHATYGVLDIEGLLQLAVDHDTEHLAALGID